MDKADGILVCWACILGELLGPELPLLTVLPGVGLGVVGVVKDAGRGRIPDCEWRLTCTGWGGVGEKERMLDMTVGRE